MLFSKSGFQAVSVVAFASILLTACSEGVTDGDRALAYAMDACGIERVESDGALSVEPVRDENGDVFVPDMSRDVVNIDTDPIQRLQDQYDDWSSMTDDANSATQLDASWERLASIMTERAGMLSAWLTTRQQGRRPSDAGQSVFDAVDKANGLLAEHNSVCRGLGATLSSQ